MKDGTCYLISGINMSGKSCFLYLMKSHNDQDSFVRVKDINKEDYLIDLRNKYKSEYKNVVFIYFVRDPRIAYGISEDRINMFPSVISVESFYETSYYIESKIHNMNPIVIKFEDFIKMSHSMKKEFLSSINKNLYVDDDSCVSADDKNIFTIRDVELFRPLTFALLYSAETFQAVETYFKSFIEKYGYEFVDFYRMKEYCLDFYEDSDIKQYFDRHRGNKLFSSITEIKNTLKRL